jgi:fructose-bisphosphate aldolase class I
MDPLEHAKMMKKMCHADGFIAALDQSGGSTPGALRLYGIKDDEYEVGEDSMFDQVHKMRTRIMTSPKFDGDRILGAILFEDTMNRKIEGLPTAEYLWKMKSIVPFLKVDKGLEPEKDGVQLMKPIPNLNELCDAALAHNILGTKMRSVINSADQSGIKQIVEQQFEFGKKIMAKGLIPILEPEVNIKAPDKSECEAILRAELHENLKLLREDQKLMFKLTLPDVDDLYETLLDHPNVVRIVALSGGYSRAEACALLERQHGIVGSFSRALTEGLRNDLSDEEFDTMLDTSIGEIFDASKANPIKKDFHSHK